MRRSGGEAASHGGELHAGMATQAEGVSSISVASNRMLYERILKDFYLDGRDRLVHDMVYGLSTAIHTPVLHLPSSAARPGSAACHRPLPRFAPCWASRAGPHGSPPGSSGSSFGGCSCCRRSSAMAPAGRRGRTPRPSSSRRASWPGSGGAGPPGRPPRSGRSSSKAQARN